MTVQRVTDDRAAVALAERLNGGSRKRPVVVVTIPAGRDEPYIDVDAVELELGELAEVYLIATGPHTWTFSQRMPERTQVYGGAGRVYPVGHGWVTDHRRSRLRFAYDAEEGRRATAHLVADALTLAVDAGFSSRPSAHRTVEGVVAGIVADRAIVDVDGVQASVSPELAVPGVPLDRVLAPGVRVRGALDARSRLLDVRASLLSAEQALAAYRAGDLVLAEVVSVDAAQAALRLHPGAPVVVPRDAVTGNDKDDLRTLMSPGEVVRARVVQAAPAWQLSLLDVDDEEEPAPAAALVAGGPPWLVEGATVPDLDGTTDAVAARALPTSIPKPSVFDRRLRVPATPETQQPPSHDHAPVASPSAAVAPTIPGPAPGPAPAAQAAHAAQVTPGVQRAAAPTPAEAMRQVARARRPAQAPAETPAGKRATGAAAHQMSLKIAALEAQLTAVRTQVVALEDQLQGSTQERDDLIGERRELQRALGQRDEQLRRARTDLRRAKRPVRVAAERGEPQFADRERGFRHAVEAAWARRFPVAEQPRRPMLGYALGRGFLDSVEALHGVSADKIADVVVEILTGLVEEMPGRATHRKRVGGGGGAQHLVREDGASLWRAALELNTPQARRIEYWKSGSWIELDNVDLHDGRLD